MSQQRKTYEEFKARRDTRMVKQVWSDPDASKNKIMGSKRRRVGGKENPYG